LKMINSLFSMFDPSSSTLKLSSLFFMSLLLIFFFRTNKISSNLSWFFVTLMSKMKQETDFTISFKKGNSLVTLSVLLFILSLNVLALFPQNFANTAQLTVTLLLALTFWVSTLMFGVFIKTNSFLSHLVPQGTPSFLMNFMVLIEITRTLIRPITLCVRLTANIVAGHLLITLLNRFLIGNSFSMFFLIGLTPFVLTILESAVAFIQAYVFVTLITLYANETQ